MDAMPVEECPDYVLRAELQRAIALLCFTPDASRYLQPLVPRLFLEAMMLARLFKKLKSEDTVLMRALNTRLGSRAALPPRQGMTPPLAVTLAALGHRTDIYKSVHPPRKIGWNHQKGPPRSRGKSGKSGNSSKSIPPRSSPSRHQMLGTTSRQLLPSTKPSGNWPSTMVWCLHMPIHVRRSSMHGAEPRRTLWQYFCPCIQKMSTWDLLCVIRLRIWLVPLWSVRRERKSWGFMPPRSMWASTSPLTMKFDLGSFCDVL